MSKHSSDPYVLFCHDPFSHLPIDASSCMKLMHTRTDFKSYTAQFDTTLRNRGYCKSWNAQKDKSLRKICHYQQKVPQHYYLLDTLVIVLLQDAETGRPNVCSNRGYTRKGSIYQAGNRAAGPKKVWYSQVEV